MSSPGLNSYDEVPYDARPRYATHPDCLATLARLLGMKPAPVERCRVLELGCSTGGNLLPLAESLPGSEFVGIDLSPRQIETGNKVAAALQLNNLRLEARSILDVGPEFGQFDYIIAHGVYSWVPNEVRDKILAICQQNLAPQGVAYVSYNTYPGWYMRAGVCDLINYHTRNLGDAAERIHEARTILEVMRKGIPEPDSAWGRTFRDEDDLLQREGDYYLFHEHLESHNQAVYFHQFIEHAQQHRLQFLGEAHIHTILSVFPQEVQQQLRRVCRDLLDLEQYLDFLKNRSFRRTLLVHADVVLDRNPGPEVAEGLLAVGMARPVSAQADLAAGVVEEFVNEAGSTVSTNVPFAKAALVLLYEQWPRAFNIEELWHQVQERLGDAAPDFTPAQARGMMTRSLVHLYLSGLAALHTYLPAATLEAGDRPQTTPLIRLQARTGALVTNRRHKEVPLTAFDRAVLSQCDGQQGRDAIIDVIAAQAQSEKVELRREGKPLTDPGEIRAALAPEVHAALDRLAHSLLLIA
ncbi:MAG: class I SAM-dependent methyltransferase [Gemmataceae bacterium]